MTPESEPSLGDANLTLAQLPARRLLLLLAAATLIVTLIWHLPQEVAYVSERMRDIVLMLVLSLALTYLLRPPVNLLNRTRYFGRGSHIGRVWATVVVFVVTILLLVGVVSLALQPVTNDIQKIAGYFRITDGQHMKNVVSTWRDSIEAAIAPYRDMLPPEMAANIEQELPQQLSNMVHKMNLQTWFMRWFSHLGFILELVLIPVLVFYFLCDGPAIRREARLLVPPAWRPRMGNMAQHFDRVLDGYIRGQVIMCLIAWALVTVGLLILGVPNAITLGIIAGITRAVPVIGPMLGGVPIVVLTLISTPDHDLATVLKVLIGFVVLHLTESKVLLPKIVGREVDLHPVSVIVALLIGLKFFGFVGIFLAVPIAAVLKVVLAEWHDYVEQQNAEIALDPALEI